MKTLFVLPILLGLIGCDNLKKPSVDDSEFVQKVAEAVKKDLMENPEILQEMVSSMEKPEKVVVVENKQADTDNPEFMNKIVQSVRKDLVENPEILQEMVSSMESKKTENANKKISEYIHTNIQSMMADAPVLGNKDAEKTIFLWSDYSCPYCRRVHADLVRVLSERKDVRVVLKNFSIHGALSDAPAKAVIAAKIQGDDKAAKLDELLMSKEYYTQDDMKNREKLAEKVNDNVMKLAKEAGLDIDKLSKDMEGDIVKKELKNVRDLAQKFEIKGTPFLIIGEKAVPGAVPYSRIIDELD